MLVLETKKYSIKTENFEGPLDLLCHLIDKNKMEISQINLSEITSQYVEFLNEQERLNLEIASEFILMASTLAYIKSKKMLPKIEDEEEEITEEELIRRIIEYKKFKEISKSFSLNHERYKHRVFKEKEKISLPKQVLEEKEYEENLIPNLYQSILDRTKTRLNENAKNIEKIAITETYSVSDKVKEMIRVLVKEKKFVFNTMFSVKKQSKNEVVTAFSGLLELSRRSKVETTQDALFGDIRVEKLERS